LKWETDVQTDIGLDAAFLDRWVKYLEPKADDKRPYLARWRKLVAGLQIAFADGGKHRVSQPHMFRNAGQRGVLEFSENVSEFFFQGSPMIPAAVAATATCIAI